MKTYNVKQVAKILGASDETVRRWIRDKKLSANCSSNKSGNVISEVSIKNFIRSFPKYSNNYYANIAKFAPAFSEFMMGGIIAALVYDYCNSRKTKDKMTCADLKSFLIKEIKRLNKLLDKKKEELLKLQDDIADIEKKINQYEYVLEDDETIESILSNINK